MSIRTVVLSTILMVTASTVMADLRYDRDDNISDRHAKALRLKAFEGEPSYQAKVYPRLSVDRDEKVSTYHATELRKQALGESVRNNVETLVQRDRDEPVSTLRATELRLRAFKDSAFDLARLGQTGGYDFSHNASINDANGHYRNHR